MKKIIGTIATLFIGLMTVHAMSYEEARERARFLTDKMAYELNLNDAQYNDAYEINLDYLMNIRTADDVTGIYWSHRNADLRYILYDWQYDLFRAASYFFRPVVWRVNVWHFPVCDFYRPGHFFYNPPRVFTVYRGGHYGHRNIHHVSFYADRRPGWHGGFRGKTHAPIVHHPAGPRENGVRSGNVNRPSTSQREPRNGMRRSNGYRIGNVNDNSRPASNTNTQRNTGASRNTTQTAQRPTRTQSTSRGTTQSGVQGRSGQTARSASSQSTYGRSNSTTSSYKRPSSTRTTVNRTSTGGNSTTRTQNAPRTPSRSSSVSRSSSPARSQSSASSASRSGRSSRRQQ